MFLALFIVSEVFVCNYDAEEDKWLRSSEPERLVRPSTKADEIDLKSINPDYADKLDQPIERHPIKFGIDMSQIVAGDRQYTGISVKLNETQAHVISVTVENMLKYVGNIIKITPYLDENLYPKKFSPRSISGSYPWLQNAEDVSCDLYVVVIAGEFDPKSNTLANAKTIRRRGDENYAGKINGGKSEHAKITLDYGMPLAGQVNINSNRIPSVPESETSGNRQFFVTIVHEFMHVLAFSNSHFNNWINRSTGEPLSKYKNPIVQIKNGYDISQKFINTEALTKWVNDRFEVTDPALQNLGLEIEDGGGSGTKGSHPNSRLYFTDVMQGKTYGPGWISPIYFHTLTDSGWYDVDISKAEELVFLDARMHGTSPPNQNLLVQPPMTNYIPDYLCSRDDTNFCFYDHSYKGVCDIESIDEWVDESGNNHKSKFNLSVDPIPPRGTKGYQWYNPLDLESIGSEALLDYNRIIVPISANCRSEISGNSEENSIWVPKLFEVYSESSICAMSTIFKGKLGEVLLSHTAACYQAECTTNNQLSLIIKGEKHMCRKKGERIFVKGKMGHAICPNPKEACANLPKRPVLNVDQVIPDRGPINGNNYVNFIGKGFSKYTPSDLELKIGIEYDKSYALDIIKIQDNSILARFPDLTGANITKMVAYSLFVTDGGELNQSYLDDIYTFVETSYPESAGFFTARPTALLLSFVLIISIIIL